MAASERSGSQAGVHDESDVVFTYGIDNNAVCVGWVCDEPKIKAELLDAAEKGYAGVVGSRAVQLKVGEWLQHGAAVLEDSEGLDTYAKQFTSSLLSKLLCNSKIIETIGDVASQAAIEREEERQFEPLPA